MGFLDTMFEEAIADAIVESVKTGNRRSAKTLAARIKSIDPLMAKAVADRIKADRERSIAELVGDESHAAKRPAKTTTRSVPRARHHE